MRRTQIYLEDAQDDEVARRAVAEGLTKSAVIRRAIEVYLEGEQHKAIGLARFKEAVRAAAGTVPRLPRGEVYVDELRAQELRGPRVRSGRLA